MNRVWDLLALLIVAALDTVWGVADRIEGHR